MKDYSKKSSDMKKKKRDREADDRRSRHLEGIAIIDFKDYELLKRFTTEQGRIIPRRLTGTSAKQQRQLKRAIRRARVMGLVK